MNKSEFVKLLSKQTNEPISVCEKIIKESKELVENLCFKGETIRFRGFGKFFLKQRLSRRTFNPLTKRYFISKNKLFINFAPTKKIAKQR